MRSQTRKSGPGACWPWGAHPRGWEPCIECGSPVDPGVSTLSHSLAWDLAGNVGIKRPGLCDRGHLACPL